MDAALKLREIDLQTMGWGICGLVQETHLNPRMALHRFITDSIIDVHAHCHAVASVLRGRFE